MADEVEAKSLVLPVGSKRLEFRQLRDVAAEERSVEAIAVLYVVKAVWAEYGSLLIGKFRHFR